MRWRQHSRFCVEKMDPGKRVQNESRGEGEAGAGTRVRDRRRDGRAPHGHLFAFPVLFPGPSPASAHSSSTVLIYRTIMLDSCVTNALGGFQLVSSSSTFSFSCALGSARTDLCSGNVLDLVTLSSSRTRFCSRWVSWFCRGASISLLTSLTYIVAISSRPALLLARCSFLPGACRENTRISRHYLRHHIFVILFLTTSAYVCASPDARILNGSFAMSNARTSFTPICLHPSTTAARGR
jgi:hypothetical protein